eukprot:CAMPEP_0170593150 /NCGR_PEP_ID=MMETSP0224-20130122/13294_1 /TAXON_ID=285029 /ORGANISM="Togula jolla, Strain CCCM 725" /LENGTH=677 /DNA_ID=CAMNT_0010917083 /DNA_START=45 /DNA_END=2076 /DNA_ORIENTATION=+
MSWTLILTLSLLAAADAIQNTPSHRGALQLSQDAADLKDLRRKEMLRIFSGGRCLGAPPKDFGDLGNSLSEEACKQRCLNDSGCNFAVLNRANGACTSYTRCSDFRTVPTMVTWRKDGALGSSEDGGEDSGDSSDEVPWRKDGALGSSEDGGEDSGDSSDEVTWRKDGALGRSEDGGEDGGDSSDEVTWRKDGAPDSSEDGGEDSGGSGDEDSAAGRVEEDEEQPLRRSFDSPSWMMQCPSGATLTTRCMSSHLYDTIVDQVQQLMRRLSSRCDTNSCDQADFLGCVVRMAGHDFMDFDPATGTGGSDACTNMEHEDNGGLAECLFDSAPALHEVYGRICDEVSLADFLVIAAEALMSFSAVGQNQASLARAFKSGFRFGRTTAAEGCRLSARNLPSPQESCDDVQRVFVRALGLNWAEAAALMGVHTLGRAEPRNSGFSGWWTSPEESRQFDNSYFVAMFAKGWCREVNVNRCSQAEARLGLCVVKHQWQRCDVNRDQLGQGHEMMLDSDLCLAFGDARGGNGKLKAREDSCCAWVHTSEPDFAMRDVVRANKNKFCSVQCGSRVRGIGDGGAFDCGDDSLSQRVRELEACCFFEEARSDCRTPGLGNDFRPGGPAVEDVRRFASDEGAWLRVFTRAWKKVTENGQAGSLGAWISAGGSEPHRSEIVLVAETQPFS